MPAKCSEPEIFEGCARTRGRAAAGGRKQSADFGRNHFCRNTRALI